MSVQTTSRWRLAQWLSLVVVATVVALGVFATVLAAVTGDTSSLETAVVFIPP